jgi:membrane protein
VDLVKQLKGRYEASAVGRAWRRYSFYRGNLLAAGVTYYAFLSIFPLMALAFTIFGLLLKGHPQWLDQIRDTINNALPGFIQDANGENGVIPLSLPGGETLAALGLVGVAVLVWSGLGWLSALRAGLRAILGVTGSPGNPVTAKLRDLAVLVVIGLGILVSAVVAAVANTAAGWLADKAGVGSQSWLVTTVGIAVQLLVNVWIVGLVIRVLSGVKLPWRGIRNGAVAGGLGLTVLQVFGARLVASTSGNPIFGSLAIVAGLLVFLNFVSRVILVSASWSANDMAMPVAPAEPTTALTQKAVEGPEQAMPVGLRDRTDAGLPTFGQRAADRTSLAAGAVLGAFGALALGTAARGVRTLLRRP